MEVWICDDNTANAESLAQLISTQEPVDVRIFSALEPLVQALTETPTLPQALFLDIVLEEHQQETSLEAAAHLHHRYPHLPIIFITAHVEYAPGMFEAAPVYMLEKPFRRPQVAAALRAIHKHSLQETADVLTIRRKGELRQVPLSSIQYIESDRRKLLVHAEDQVYTYYGKLPALLSELPPYFVQCHQSYAVNLNQVKSLQAGGVTLLSDITLPVSRRRYQAFRSAVDLFMAQTTFFTELPDS